MNDSSSLVVTPSSIPSFATHGPDADLSSKGSDNVLEDPNDEPTKKKRISDSDEDESVDFEIEFMSVPLSPFFFLSFVLPFFVIFTLFIYLCNPFAVVSLYFVCPFYLIAETPGEPGVAVDIEMPTTTPPTTLTAPISTIPTMSISAVPSIPVFALPTAPILTGPGEFLFPYLLLPFFLVSLSFSDHSFSYHALCFLDRSTSHCPSSI